MQRPYCFLFHSQHAFPSTWLGASRSKETGKPPHIQYRSRYLRANAVNRAYRIEDARCPVFAARFAFIFQASWNIVTDCACT